MSKKFGLGKGLNALIPEDTNIDSGIAKKQKEDSEKNLIDALGTIPVSESVLAEVVKKSISEIKSELVVLELQGLVRKVDGGYVRV